MFSQHPAIDWDKGKNAGVFSNWPSLDFTLRDWIWLIVLAGLTTTYGVDRWRIRKRHDTDLAALADAQTAADHRRSEIIALQAQLRSARDTLEASSHNQRETISNLHRQITALQEELRKAPALQYTSGRASHER